MKLIVEILVLSAIYKFSAWITSLLHLPVPSILVGMALLLFLLTTGLVKPNQLERSSQFLSRHMVLFFIPIIVGIVQYWEVMKQGGLLLLFTIVVSTVFVIISTAFFAILFKKRREIQ